MKAEVNLNFLWKQLRIKNIFYLFYMIVTSGG